MSSTCIVDVPHRRQAIVLELEKPMAIGRKYVLERGLLHRKLTPGSNISFSQDPGLVIIFPHGG